MQDTFRRASSKIAKATGSVWAFVFAFFLVGLWLSLGPALNYSNTWQLMINTTTTIITFLMVFLIQNTQNRDAKAVHLKLDELLRVIKGARADLLETENLPDTELELLHQDFKLLHEKYAKEIKKRDKGEKRGVLKFFS